MRVDSGSISDVGRKRKSNEDNYCVNDEEGLYLVADGMGGHAAGEVASELVAEAIEEFIKLTSSDADITWPFGLDGGLTLSGNRLKTAIPLRESKAARKDQRKRGMRGYGDHRCLRLGGGGQGAHCSRWR